MSPAYAAIIAALIVANVSSPQPPFPVVEAIALAYAFEQATKRRAPPAEFP
jgi:hypothetical protein